MKKLILTIALACMFMVNTVPVYAHGDDGDHDEPMQIQTPAEAKMVALAPDASTFEIIPNWHPLFVHFTVALLLIATLLFVIGKLAPVTTSWRTSCLTVARWNLVLGAIITIGTVLAGSYAFNTVLHDNFSHEPMRSHRLWALSTAGVFIALALWSILTRKKEPHLLLVAGLLIASGLLTVTAYKGGELVYRHGLGVMSMPQMDGHMHHHDADSPMTMPEMKDMPDMDKDHDHHD
ncbi:MAG: DUF2231 domain-containing protein [Alphaproteobacteria bacterium]